MPCQQGRPSTLVISNSLSPHSNRWGYIFETTTLVLVNSFDRWRLWSRMRWLNASYKPPTAFRQLISHTHAELSSACRLCSILGAFTTLIVTRADLAGKKAPWKVFVGAWAHLWVLLSPHPQTGPSFLALAWLWWTQLIFYHHGIHLFLVPSTLLPTSHHAVCSPQPRDQRRSFIKRVTSSSTGICSGSCRIGFSWRHCCRSSRRWRGAGGPEACCWPGLCECGALGRGRWPTAAHPRGPPCDKPGNVWWRPVWKVKGTQLFLEEMRYKFIKCNGKSAVTFFPREVSTRPLLLQWPQVWGEIAPQWLLVWCFLEGYPAVTGCGQKAGIRQRGDC